jgi:hypothetical protein
MKTGWSCTRRELLMILLFSLLQLLVDQHKDMQAAVAWANRFRGARESPRESSQESETARSGDAYSEPDQCKVWAHKRYVQPR